MPKRKQPKREKQLRDLRNRIARLEASREAAVKMLVKAERELPTLRKQAKRLADVLLAAQVEPPAAAEPEPRVETTPAPEPAMDDPNHPDLVAARALLGGVNGALKVAAPVYDPGEIPTALRREPPKPPEGSSLAPEVYAAAHAVANNHNRPATDEEKKIIAREKRAVKKQVLDAELRGQRRKPPLTGREAEAFLRGK